MQKSDPKMVEETLENRVKNLEEYVLNLQQQINRMLTNPTITIGQVFDGSCRCHLFGTTQFFKINDVMICSTCNKPLNTLQG